MWKMCNKDRWIHYSWEDVGSCNDVAQHITTIGKKETGVKLQDPSVRPEPLCMNSVFGALSQDKYMIYV